MTTAADLNRAYSVREVAERTSLSVAGVKRLIYDGKLGHLKIGKRVLVTAAHLEAFLSG